MFALTTREASASLASSRRSAKASPAPRAARDVRAQAWWKAESATSATTVVPPPAPVAAATPAPVAEKVVEKVAPAPVAAVAPPPATNEYDLSLRQQQVQEHFPTALGIDDFLARVEVVLSGYGFTGDNSIAMTNLCRDEVTTVMKDKIEAVFGSSFNTNGLGAVLTCGATGMGAGLSHSPVCDQGRERYVFFSFPHIAINGEGTVGSISRPGRAGTSCACGALAKCLKEFQAEGFSCNCKVPGVHDALDPEYTILKQRLARRLRYEQADVNKLTLASITSVAERTITNDLEYLIEKAIDTKKADYAVVTGVQIHNWASNLEEGGAPSMEFAAPTRCYVVINGSKIHLDLTKVPAPSPRQLVMLAAKSNGALPDPDSIITQTPSGVLQEIPYSYLQKRLAPRVAKSSVMDTRKESKPSWHSIIRSKSGVDRDQAAPTMDSLDEEFYTSFQVK